MKNGSAKEATGEIVATVQKEIIIAAGPAQTWAFIADFVEGPVRMAPGFVTDSRLDGADVRVVTFANGTVLRERLVALDQDARRLAFSVVGGSMEPAHDNSSMQVFEHGDGQSRFVWIHDVLPDALADQMGVGMHQGVELFKQTVEATTQADG